MKYEKEYKIIKNAEKRALLLLKLVGLFPVEKKNATFFRKILPYFIAFLLSSIGLGCMNFVYHNRHNIIIVLKASSLIFSITTILLKVISYTYYRDELLELHNTMDSFIDDHIKDDKLASVMIVPLLFFSKKLTIPIIICAYAIMVSLYSQPALFMIKQFINNVQPIKYILPYPTIYPYHIEGGSLLWILHWTWETLCNLAFVSVGCSTDNIFAFYSTNIIAQLRVLAYEVENSTLKDKKNIKFHKYIILKHQKIIKCCYLLQSIIGLVVLTMTILTALILCSLTFQISQVTSYIYYRNDLLELHNILDTFMDEHIKDDKLASVMIVPLLVFSKKLTIPIIICAYAIMVSLYSQPALFMIKQFINNVQPIKYILPYPTIYPYHIEGGSILWALHWTWETLCNLAFVSVGCSTDNIFAFYSTNIIAQLRVLSYEIENSTLEDKKSIKFYIYIILKHQKIIKCCYLLKNIIGLVVLIMTISTALILCSLTFQISQMETITGQQIAWISIYIWYKLLQAFLYARMGEEIFIANTKFQLAVYNSGWECFNIKSYSYFINMLLIQKPMYLEACGLVEISAQMFAKIINTSMSYFFLLQTLNQD
ncbi:hypothetical protein HCN44_007468 [Aphidius gifuensis]|uniref:Odorant receptor n=1 Tax=Aphidius gifuensis TaxID=684658 RepID=A0A834XL20_APHGI|nr:hypothetical protein HCN44_007468 [Aphidius gifuensis]